MKDYAKSPNGSFDIYSMIISSVSSSCKRIGLLSTALRCSSARVFFSSVEANEELPTSVDALAELK
jgi:hypothetical protein